MTNYRIQAENEVDEAKERRNNSDDGRESVEQIDVDMNEIPFVKFTPTVAITGTVPEGEGNPVIRFPDESTNGHSEQGYLGLVLDDVSVDTEDSSDRGGFDLSEATIVETDDDDYTEYRAVNFNDEKTVEKFDGEAVSIDGDQYGIESRSTEVDGRVILVVDRLASVSVAKKIDVDGATVADMDESTGQPNTGLIEYSPEDGGSTVEGYDGTISWRYARPQPEMREELLGGEITVLVARREELDGELTGYLGQNGDNTEPILGYGVDEDGEEVTHRDEQEASYAELVAADEARPMMWYSVFDADGESLEPVEGEATGYSYLEWRFDKTVGPDRLPDDEWEFVQNYQTSDLSDDEETIRHNVQQNFDGADEDRIVELIQSGAGA